MATMRIDSASGHDPVLRERMNDAIRLFGEQEFLRIILENYCDDQNFSEILDKCNSLLTENDTGLSV